MPDPGHDQRRCRHTLRGGSRSFHLASQILPDEWRRSAVALYAFCRVADDAIDQSPTPARALADLHARVEAMYAQVPRAFAEDRAFAECIRRHSIPRNLPLALLEGFAWDAQGRSYPDLAALEDYAMRVAGTVGAMMALILGVRDEETFRRACQLGVAMQLTNIARDVAEDARHGRLYLPHDLLLKAGIEPAGFLRTPVSSAGLGECIRTLLARADALYRSANAGIARLPLRARPAMYAASFLYEEIGAEVCRRGFALAGRAVVARRRKLGRMVAAGLASVGHTTPVPCVELPAAEPLVSACHLPGLGPEATRGIGVSRVEWLVRLFDRLERAQVRI